jgi:hypothetical protein
LFGQRFIVDSYISGEVVYDKITYNGKKERRMLPSTLDILFALGNNASAQLLQSELDEHHYSSNLSALRYLIDSYGSDFWETSIYNLWLNSIRSLNPPTDRSGFPKFMQTAAWWQEKMNTQLASWAELRHDNILYGKAPYSDGISCSYPCSYVEPIPSLYISMRDLALIAKEKISALTLSGSTFFNAYQSLITNYLNNLYWINNDLAAVAQKELDSTSLNDNEKSFLQNMLYKNSPECNPEYGGWYTYLYYHYSWNTGEFYTKKDIVADVHTAPTNEYGDPVGWVLHAGTGKVNMGIFTIPNSEGQLVAYLGPVSSYYEYTTTNFKRLTDDEWKSTYLALSTRPSFANLYLADANGNLISNVSSLITGVNEPKTIIPTELTLNQNYPNPFNSTTIISYTIPNGMNNSFAELSIYDTQGKLVVKLLNSKLQAGNYVTRWDGKNMSGITVSSGMYFCTLKIGKLNATKKLVLMK